MSSENVEVVRQAFAAFNEGDPEPWLSRYDPDIVLVVASGAAPEPGTYVGAEAVRAWFDGFFLPFGRSFHIEVVDAIAAGDSVVAVQRNVARGRASGIEVEAVNVASVVTFRAGCVIRLDVVKDRGAALRLVGLRG